ncbi:hypothetical protein EDEG_00870 [Edhazardia aedis USNM 41457]|uniref:Peptidase S8/S53 domain-containing protein n=1 Tax=Edhazardia aedis (strain USNM 41457) TaxID=1003232 RepID=J9DR31_EDHAE|nr:hypothetical protein EDEG_00870 [Edhazardia aedis USNM 41457]|eukprot:EJW05035.1 hypothetical protein EDEG_00870 [Edhazardia aedis USNM 41457]
MKKGKERDFIMKLSNLFKNFKKRKYKIGNRNTYINDNIKSQINDDHLNLGTAFDNKILSKNIDKKSDKQIKFDNKKIFDILADNKMNVVVKERFKITYKGIAKAVHRFLFLIFLFGAISCKTKDYIILFHHPNTLEKSQEASIYAAHSKRIQQHFTKDDKLKKKLRNGHLAELCEKTRRKIQQDKGVAVVEEDREVSIAEFKAVDLPSLNGKENVLVDQFDFITGKNKYKKNDFKDNKKSETLDKNIFNEKDKIDSIENQNNIDKPASNENIFTDEKKKSSNIVYAEIPEELKDLSFKTKKEDESENFVKKTDNTMNSNQKSTKGKNKIIKYVFKEKNDKNDGLKDDSKIIKKEILVIKKVSQKNSTSNSDNSNTNKNNKNETKENLMKDGKNQDINSVKTEKKTIETDKNSPKDSADVDKNTEKKFKDVPEENHNGGNDIDLKLPNYIFESSNSKILSQKDKEKGVIPNSREIKNDSTVKSEILTLKIVTKIDNKDEIEDNNLEKNNNTEIPYKSDLNRNSNFSNQNQLNNITLHPWIYNNVGYGYRNNHFNDMWNNDIFNYQNFMRRYNDSFYKNMLEIYKNNQTPRETQFPMIEEQNSIDIFGNKENQHNNDNKCALYSLPTLDKRKKIITSFDDMVNGRFFSHKFDRLSQSPQYTNESVLSSFDDAVNNENWLHQRKIGMPTQKNKENQKYLKQQKKSHKKHAKNHNKRSNKTKRHISKLYSEEMTDQSRDNHYNSDISKVVLNNYDENSSTNEEMSHKRMKNDDISADSLLYFEKESSDNGTTTRNHRKIKIKSNESNKYNHRRHKNHKKNRNHRKMNYDQDITQNKSQSEFYNSFEDLKIIDNNFNLSNSPESAEKDSAIAEVSRDLYFEEKKVGQNILKQTNSPWGISRISQVKNKNNHTFYYPESAGEGVDVYVIDTGIEIDHPEFEGRAKWGINILEDTLDTDEHGHGTHCAGVIGGKNTGVAKKTNLIAVKVLDKEGKGRISSIILGVDYVIDQHSQKMDALERKYSNVFLKNKKKTSPYKLSKKSKRINDRKPNYDSNIDKRNNKFNNHSNAAGKHNKFADIDSVLHLRNHIDHNSSIQTNRTDLDDLDSSRSMDLSQKRRIIDTLIDQENSEEEKNYNSYSHIHKNNKKAKTKFTTLFGSGKNNYRNNEHITRKNTADFDKNQHVSKKHKIDDDSDFDNFVEEDVETYEFSRDYNDLDIKKTQEKNHRNHFIEDLAEYMTFDIQKPKTVVNMSVGGGKSRAVNFAIDYAAKLGIHFSVAAGNDHEDACYYSPASSKNALTVGASTREDTVAPFSNNGHCVGIFAPGEEIVSAWIGNKYQIASGTSMASPHVAGVFSLQLSIKNASPDELRAQILNDSIKVVTPILNDILSMWPFKLFTDSEKLPLLNITELNTRLEKKELSEDK